MKWGYTWAEQLGLPECKYLIRWVLWLGKFSVRLHYWKASDDQEYHHDHEWWFHTFVLWGSYTDIDANGNEDTLTMGSHRYRTAEYQHKVKVLRPTITLLVTGLPERVFGFWVNGKFIKARRYFFQYGHHPCIEGEDRVKTKPNNGRTG